MRKLQRFGRRTIQWLIRFYSIRGRVVLGEGTHVGPGSLISSTTGLIIGDGVYIGKGCTIQVSGSIGRGTIIANGVGIVGRRDHDFRVIGIPVSYAPWIGSSDSHLIGTDVVQIGEDVWLGYGCVVLSGVTIGRGAIVAAGTIVTKTVAPYDIIAGNPGHVVGRRFDDTQILAHEEQLLLLWSDWKHSAPETRKTFPFAERNLR